MSIKQNIYKKDLNFKERNIEDRRKQQSKGYIYISIVGWICRREKIRRKDDTLKWD